MRKFGSFISHGFYILNIQYQLHISLQCQKQVINFFSFNYEVRQILFSACFEQERDKLPINSAFRLHHCHWAWKLFQAEWLKRDRPFFLFIDLIVLAEVKTPSYSGKGIHTGRHLNFFPYLHRALLQRTVSFHLICIELASIQLLYFKAEHLLQFSVRKSFFCNIFFSSDTPLFIFQLVPLFTHQLCWIWTSPYWHWVKKSNILQHLFPSIFCYCLSLIKCSVNLLNVFH